MRLIAFLAGLLWTASALAQGTGVFTPGHLLMATTPSGVPYIDAGPALGGAATELGITNTGTPFCIADAAVSSLTGFHQLCLGANSGGSGIISFNAFGGATPLGLNIILNGNTYPFPPAGGGNVSGPMSSVVNNVVLWNNTSGTLLQDSGLAPPGSAFLGVDDVQTVTHKLIDCTATNTCIISNASLTNPFVIISGHTLSLGGSLTLSGADILTGTLPNARLVAVPNSALANSSVTISGHSLSLGGSLALATGDISGLGTLALQNANALNVSNVTLLTGVPNPINSTDAATKGYVDASSTGIEVKPAVKYATAAALGANTYNNGTLGVGATITITANATCAIDGSTPIASDRVLIKDEAAQANNGAYTVTAPGSGGSQCVYTRATDYDQSAEILAGTSFFVSAGSTNAATTWIQATTGTITVGTTAVVFNQFGAANTYLAGAGLNLSGNTFSVLAGGITNAMLAGSIANAKLTNSAVTLNAGTSTGLTVPGSVSLGATGVIGSTSDALRFGSLTLNGALTAGTKATISGPVDIEPGTVTIAGADAPGYAGFWASTTLAGTVTAPLVLPQGYVTPTYYFNCLDTVNAPAVSGNPSDVQCVSINRRLNSASSVGSRSTLGINTKIDGTLGAVAGNNDYVGIENTFTISANQGGGSGTEKGDVFGAGIQFALLSGATFLSSARGKEIDCSAASGSSVLEKTCMLILSYNSDVVHGSSIDAALEFSTQDSNSHGWNCVICFGGSGWPTPSTGTLIGTNGTTGTSAFGIDLSGATITNTLLKGNAKIIMAGSIETYTNGNGISFDSGADGTMVSMTGPGATVTNGIALTATTGGSGDATIASTGAGGAAVYNLLLNPADLSGRVRIARVGTGNGFSFTPGNSSTTPTLASSGNNGTTGIGFNLATKSNDGTYKFNHGSSGDSLELGSDGAGNFTTLFTATNAVTFAGLTGGGTQRACLTAAGQLVRGGC